MDEMKYICLYNNYLQIFSPYTERQVGRLVLAMLRYAKLGEVPEFAGEERYVWPTLQYRMDSDAQAYRDRVQTSRRNGAKGGRPKKTAKETSEE